MRRVSGCDRQFQTFPVGGEFVVLVLGIAEVVDGKLVELIRPDMVFLQFVGQTGQTPGALVQIDVLDFVSEVDRRCLFVRHQSQNSATHHDLNSRISDGTPQTGMRIGMKLVRQLAPRVLGDFVTDLLQTGCNALSTLACRRNPETAGRRLPE
jgi:hypothetical protein